MMKHKSILIILLVIALVFTVAACSGPSKEAKAVTKARAASDPFVEKLENAGKNDVLSLTSGTPLFAGGNYSDTAIENAAEPLFNALSANAVWKYKMADVRDDTMRLYYDVKLPDAAALMQRYREATADGTLNPDDKDAVGKFFAAQTFTEDDLKQIVVFTDMIKDGSDWRVANQDATLKQAFINNTSVEIDYNMFLSGR